MEERREVKEGWFEWKVPNFEERINMHQNGPFFYLGRSKCYLRVTAKNSASEEVYLNTSNKEKLSYKTFCKMSVIDGWGNEFIVAKRKILQSNDGSVCLIAVHNNELTCKENNLLPDGVLTLRLAWCCENTPTVSDLNSGRFPTKLFAKLSEDMGTLYEKKICTDSVLMVSDKQFLVHRAILSARSAVFAAMFRHDTSESRSGVVNILDVDASILDDVLHYIYSGQIQGLTPETAASMFLVADKYALLEMRGICLNFLIHNITSENVDEAVSLAQMHENSELKKKLAQFLRKNTLRKRKIETIS